MTSSAIAALEAELAELTGDDQFAVIEQLERVSAAAIDAGDLALAERGLAACSTKDPDAAPAYAALQLLQKRAPLWEVIAALEPLGTASYARVALVGELLRRLTAHGSKHALALAYLAYDRVRDADDEHRFAAAACRILRRTGDDRRALKTQGTRALVALLQRRLRIAPDDVDTMIALADIAHFDDPEAARAAIARAYDLAPDRRRVIELAIPLFIEVDPPRAVGIVHAYAVDHPEDGSIYYRLGRTAERSRQPEIALEAYRIAAERGSWRAARDYVELAKKRRTWDSVPAADRERLLALIGSAPGVAPPTAPPTPLEAARERARARAIPRAPAGTVVKPTYTTRHGPLTAGTAFVLAFEGRELLVTAQHVFGPPGGLRFAIPAAEMPAAVPAVDFAGGAAGAALRIPYASHAERADIAAFPIAAREPGAPLALAAEPPSYGDPVWLGGDRGTVSTIEDELIEIELDDKLELAGASGAPVLDAAGNVAAMLVRVAAGWNGRPVGHALGLPMLRGFLADALDPAAAKEPPMRRRLTMSLHVATVASLTQHQASALLVGFDPDTGELVSFLHTKEALRVRLTYPLESPYELSIEPDDLLSVGDVVWQIAKGYDAVYREPSRHGVWGHGIGDLYIEALDFVDGTVEVSVGS